MKITQATKSKVLRMYARTSNHIKKIQPHNSINASDTPRSLRVQTKLAACTIKRIVTSCIVTSHALYLNGTRSITCMDRGSCLIAIKMAPSASFETKNCLMSGVSRTYLLFVMGSVVLVRVWFAFGEIEARTRSVLIGLLQ